MASTSVQNSKISIYYVRIMTLFLIIRFLFHIIFFYKSTSKNLIKIDLKNEIEQYKIPLCNNILQLLWALKFDPYFLSLFYYRIGPSKSSICKIFKYETSSFHIIGDNIESDITLYHPFSTIINAKSIGSGLKIRNTTTIGNIHNSQDYRPIIGNNVDIGANSVIIGKIKIGNNVTIGAGTLINKDVPDNAIVVGNPFRIIGFHHETT